ncbi:MAG: glycine cleavage system protein GcvH [Nocardioidaceae bacterium]|nr:glycine cleavage system protein GcvH [Nocardioidaceae bacterium]
MYPDDLKYTAEHEWVRVEEDGVVVGVTQYAQEQLGDIVYVALPQAGDTIAPGTSIGELESTKSVSDLFAPVAGVVTARNEQLDQTPELVNSDPYGEGWLIKVRVEDASAISQLLDADEYRSSIGQ